MSEWRSRVHLGYSLSSEEHPAPDLVRYAVRAEAAGFEYASLSDHFHPWVGAQGNSPFAHERQILPAFR